MAGQDQPPRGSIHVAHGVRSQFVDGHGYAGMIEHPAVAVGAGRAPVAVLTGKGWRPVTFDRKESGSWCVLKFSDGPGSVRVSPYVFSQISGIFMGEMDDTRDF